MVQWNLSLDELCEIQKQELSLLLEEAYNYVPFYKKRFENLSISLIDIKENPVKVLQQMPFLTKNERRNFAKEIVNTNPNRPIVEIGYTSGTSGTPTENYLDQESIDRSFALWSRFHETIGIKKPLKSVRFSGRLVVKPTQKTNLFGFITILINNC